MARKKKNPLNLSRFTLAYLIDRREALIESAGERNDRLDRYERYYNLDFWTDEPGENELRVTLPLAWDAVEKYKALTFGRMWSISVPPNEPADTERVQKLEAYLYGVTGRTRLFNLADMAEANALMMERAWLKATYDASAAEDEFPIKVIVPDPRTVYVNWESTRARPLELVQTWNRTRREIEAEWGIELPRTAQARRNEDDWLDTEVEYSEYWKEEIVLDYPAIEENDGEDEPTSTIEMMAADIAAALAGPPALDEPNMGERMAADGMLELDDTRKAEDKGAAGKKREKKRMKRIVHAVWVGADEKEAVWVKKPLVAVGYKRVPYFGWAGIGTSPANKKYDGLSLLFPLTGGDAPDMGMGVLHAMNLMASTMLDETVRRAHAPLMTDDPQAQIDVGPDAINVVSPGRQLNYMQPPPMTGDMQRMMENLNRVLDRVGTPEVLNGQVFNLSGQAISGLANAFQMVIAQRQHEREQALTDLYAHVLCITKEYADPAEGWEAYGDGKYGRYVNAKVKPSDVGSTYRAVVKLSSSMPKDDIGMISLFARLWDQGAIGWETLLDQFQKLFGLASESPSDEIIRVMMDKMLRSDATMKVVEPVAQEYARLVQASVGGGQPQAPQPQPQPQQPMNQPQPAGMPMTPDMVNPQTVAANGNLQGAMQMPGLMR